MTGNALIETNWQSLVAAALLGTGRQPPPSLPATDAVTTLLAQIDKSDAEANLLGQAGLLTLVRKAGKKAVQRQVTHALAQDEERPVASVAANRILATMLGGSHIALLPEWLQLAADRRRCVGEEHLPALLDMGANRKAFADPIRSVIGKRGEWLATLNPDWNYALGIAKDLEAVWETGIEAQRIQAFRALRQSDPVQALQLLRKSWANEPSDLRSKVLPLFATGLSMADEEFLEAALDDRRKEVREAAANLLAKLPQSRLSERMVSRVKPLLKVSGLLRKSMEVTLPSECTIAMQRDGIAEKVPVHFQQMGEKAWWLCQMLSFIPTKFWLNQFDLSCQKLIDYAARSDWNDLLLDSWLDAAALHGETEMLIALADQLISGNPAQVARVVDVLPTSYLEERIIQQLRRRDFVLSGHEPIMLLLFNNQRPWSDELSKLFVAKLQYSLTQPFNYQPYGWMSGQLAQIALHISPVVCAPNGLDLNVTREDWIQVSRSIDEFAAVVHFRYEMRQAF